MVKFTSRSNQRNNSISIYELQLTVQISGNTQSNNKATKLSNKGEQKKKNI